MSDGMLRKLLVKFFTKSREDPAATRDAGRPVFKDVEYIDIKIPGNRRSGACRPAGEADKKRFPRHYEAFKQRTEAPIEGTPLSEWPIVSRSMAEEMAFFHVKTVEQLASMSDTNGQNFMGINTLKAKAKAWLERSKKGADEARLTSELEKRDLKIAALEEKLNALANPKTPEAPKKRVTKKRAAKAKVDDTPPWERPKGSRRAALTKKAEDDASIQEHK